MSPMEIAFVVLGIALIIISCFLTKESKEKTDTLQLSDEVLEVQKKEIEKLVRQILEERTEEAVVKADDYLSKISNEKIMAVNEFTDQIFERIDSNHKEVVFLYDMLNQKEDEIKKIVREFDSEKGEMREVVDEVSRMSKQLITRMKKTEGSSTKKASESEKKADEKKTDEKKKVQTGIREKNKPVEGTTENSSSGQMEFTDMLTQDTQKEEILRLYKQGKSILEISKSLGIGQGEVKLIVGLYAQ